MKCPLFIMSDTRVQLGEETEIGDCLKEECAWWGLYRVSEDKERGCCSVPAIALCLTDIIVKMPHEEQFRRR